VFVCCALYTPFCSLRVTQDQRRAWIFQSFSETSELFSLEMSVDHWSGSGVTASDPSERGDEVQCGWFTPLLFGTWNCNGLNENSVVIAAEGCDVLGLTETHDRSVDRLLTSKHRLVGQGQIAFMASRKAAASVITVTFPHKRWGTCVMDLL